MPGFCEDCGKPSVGSYSFFYANERENRPQWSPAREVCLMHKRVREAAGHRSRIPIEDSQDNAPDPVAVGTQAADYDKNPSGQKPAATA